MEIWNRRSYVKDIKFLKEIIEDSNVLGVFTGIDNIIEAIETSEKDLIDYRLSNFSIYLKGAIARAQPKNLHYCKIELENRLEVKDNLNAKIDPLSRYSLDFKISLYKSERNQTKEYCSTWHLDKEHRDLNFSYVHPYYHMQFGGKKHEYLDPDMAVLGSPSIPHPPMDLILGFHFIINNFVDRKVHDYVDKILLDPRYIRILANSKKRLWEPYFNGYSTEFNHEDYTINNLFPLYKS
jgi:hypothetical protein